MSSFEVKSRCALHKHMELEERGNPTVRSVIQQILIHGLPMLALLPGIREHVTAFDWWLAFALYYIRMFFITGGYHRYFSHKSYKTSRVFQFIIAYMAETSMQKGVLWWGSHHRIHHKESDKVTDPHSMKHYGFWYSHLGWIMSKDYKKTHYGLIQDYAKFKELIWINRFHIIPPLTLLIGVFIWGGYEKAGITGEFNLNGAFASAFIGFFFSTMVLYHGTFSINSIMHKFGKPRYKTGDESKNNLILALVTLGEGWHNNHHYYMSSTRQGFFWWEIDITYYILKLLSYVGIVWDIKEVPDHVKESNRVDSAA